MSSDISNEEVLTVSSLTIEDKEQEAHLEPLVVDDSDPDLAQHIDEYINRVENLENTPADDSKPYEYKYRAYALLEDVEQQIKVSIVERVCRDDKMLSVHGKILFRMGVIAYDTDEWSKGEKHIKQAIQLLQKDTLDQETVGNETYIQTLSALESSQYTENSKVEKGEETKLESDDLSPAGLEVLESVQNGSDRPRHLDFVCDFAQSYNYLGMIWTGRSDHRLAELCFKKAERIYHAFQDCREDQVIENDSPLLKRMESIFTMITFFLAQMYSSLNFPHLSAKYSFLTLKRQLNSEQNFDKEEWAVNAMTLSNYYLNYDDFSQSEHCLNAAQHMLQLVGCKKNEQSDPNLQLAIARHYHVWLDYSMKWLMQNSRKSESEIASREGDEGIGSRVLEFNEPDEPVTISPQHSVPTIQFDNVPIDSPRPYHVIVNFEQALPAFKSARRGYEAGLKYYILDGFVSDHIGNLQNLSNLYSVLSFFERSVERIIAMHERRTQLYERNNLIGELNPRFYNGELKQISFELGEIYSEILDLQVEQGQSTHKPIEITFKAIRCFEFFIKQFVDPESGKEKIEEINYHAYVRARLHLARLYYKLEVKDKQETLKNWTMSLQEYDKVIALCKDKKIEGVLQQEIEMAKQMRDLIPLKMREYMMRSGMN